MRLLLIAAALVWSARGQSVKGQSVTGRVVNSATERAVAGATVVLQGAEDSYVVETDGNGSFQAADVVPGAYEVRTVRDGFTALARGASSKAYPRFTLEAGRNVQDILVRLIPLGAISGRVLDADGDPVSRGSVEAVGHSYADGKKTLRDFGRTQVNDRGEFRVPGLAPGRYFLRFRPGAAFAASANTNMRVLGSKAAYVFSISYFPASNDVAGATPLDLPPGGELRDHVILVQREQLYTIRVTLMTSQSGASRPSVGVASPSGMGFMMSAQYGVALSFADSAPGNYLVEGRDIKLGLAAQQWIKVVNSDVDVTLTLRPAFALGGMVWTESGGQLALDKVQLTLQGEGAYYEATVKADGTFSFARVQPIPYKIRVSTPTGGYLKAIWIGEAALATPQIDLSGSIGALAIVLGTDGACLEGSLEEGAVVVAEPTGRLRDWQDLVRTATARKDGTFDLRDLAPGEYRVFAWLDAEEGAPLDADFRRAFESQSVLVRVEPNGRQTVQLRPITM